MKTATLLFAPLLLATGVISQSFTCDGDLFNDYCCSHGSFSGPVMSSFLQSFSNRDSSMSASFASRASSLSASQASLQASLSSKFSTMTQAADSMITARAELVRRAITTEVTPGLTCIGDAVSSIPSIGGGITSSTSNSGPSEVVASTRSSSPNSAAAASASSSPNFAPMITQAPVIVAGAAAVFAYGAM